MKDANLIGVTDMYQSVKKVWANSLGVVLALVVGVIVGIVYKQGDIIEDCRYSGSFRVHSQAFTCVRKI